MSDRPQKPFYAIEIGTGIAIRDAKGRCIGTLSIRDWVEDRRECAKALISQLAEQTESED